VPVIYRENRIIAVARDFSSKTRFFITFLILFSFSTVWFLFLYYPLLLQYNEDLINIEMFSTQQKYYKKTVNKLSLFEETRKNLNLSLKSLQQKSEGGQKDLRFAIDSLKNFELICKEFMPVDAKSELDFDKEYFILRAKGSFKNFISYFDFLNNAGNPISFKEADFKLGKNQMVKLFAKIRFISFRKMD